MSGEDARYAVFISYASADKKNAGIVCLSLEKRGFRCWIAPRDVRAGHEYPDEIIRGIEESRCVVLLLSKAANESAFVRAKSSAPSAKRSRSSLCGWQRSCHRNRWSCSSQALEWIDIWKGAVKSHMDRLQQELASTLAVPQLARPSRLAAVRHWFLRTATAAVLLAVLAGAGFAAKRLVWDSQGAKIAAWFSQYFAGHASDEQDAPNDASFSLANSEQPPATPLGGDPAVGTESGADASRGFAGTASPQPKRASLSSPAGLTANAYALLESYKRMALQRESWLRESLAYDRGFVSDSRLDAYFPAVRRIRLGESPDNLDRVIEIPASPPVEDKHAIAAASSSYCFNLVPYRLGATQLYVQLEFYDGTRSDPKRWSPGADRLGRYGVRVPAEAGAAGKTAPPLFAATQHTLTNDREFYEIRLVPDPPVGTSEVMYSFDEEGFFKAVRFGDDLFPFSEQFPCRGFFVSRPVSDTLVRLLFKKKDGTQLGPFRYQLKDAQSLIVNMLKPLFAKDELVQKLSCLRVQTEFPLNPAGFSNSGDYALKMKSIGEQLTRAGLGFIERAPVIVCLPANQGNAAHAYYDWGYVREVRIGHKMGSLEAIPVQVSIENVIACNVPRSRAEVWRATLPADAKAVYVQFVFKDGRTSDEIRLPIVDFILTP